MAKPTPSKFQMVRTAAAWIDLLGYGASFEKVAHLLGTAAADPVMERAFRFHQTIQPWIRQDTRIVVLNDGCLVSADLQKPGDAYKGHYWRKKESDFVEHVLRIHEKVNTADNSAGGPGVRMVVCLGERVHRGSGVPNLQRKHLRNTSQNIGKKLSPAAAHAARSDMFVAEANDPTVVSTRHLQHNLAFARAYLAENLGSRIGLSGNHAYVDSRLLSPKQLSAFQSVASLPLLGTKVDLLRAP